MKSRVSLPFSTLIYDPRPRITIICLVQHIKRSYVSSAIKRETNSLPQEMFLLMHEMPVCHVSPEQSVSLCKHKNSQGRETYLVYRSNVKSKIN